MWKSSTDEHTERDLARGNTSFSSPSQRQVVVFCLLFYFSLIAFWGQLPAMYFHISVLPYHCPLCSVMSWRQWKWCQADCCHPLGCLHHLSHLCKRCDGKTVTFLNTPPVSTMLQVELSRAESAGQSWIVLKLPH